MRETELKLRTWRGGQIGAERLAAELLHIDGFVSVDPQCPLGGPDGLKDVLCEKNGWKYVAAVYFPNTEQTFPAIKRKFHADLKGVAANQVDGLVFITNQSLSPGNRKTLGEVAKLQGHTFLIYHLERLRGLLDAPAGFGARLEYLRIQMSQAEQLSFFATWNDSLADKLHTHGMMVIREVCRKIDAVFNVTSAGGPSSDPTALFHRTVSDDLTAEIPSSDKRAISEPNGLVGASAISIESLCMLHRALLSASPSRAHAGALRSTKVRIGDPTEPLATTKGYQPPPATQVVPLLEQLLSAWNLSMPVVRATTTGEKIAAMTQFHHGFLRIHPFTDGNGRIARFLLEQHAIELLNHHRPVIVEDRRPYFEALGAADRGDQTALRAVISQSIFGAEDSAGAGGMKSARRRSGVDPK